MKLETSKLFIFAVHMRIYHWPVDVGDVRWFIELSLDVAIA